MGGAVMGEDVFRTRAGESEISGKLKVGRASLGEEVEGLEGWQIIINAAGVCRVAQAGRQAGRHRLLGTWALGHLLWVVKGSLKGSAGSRGSWLVNLGDWRSSQRRAGARTDCRRALAGSSAKTHSRAQTPCLKIAASFGRARG